MNTLDFPGYLKSQLEQAVSDTQATIDMASELWPMLPYDTRFTVLEALHDVRSRPSPETIMRVQDLAAEIASFVRVDLECGALKVDDDVCNGFQGKLVSHQRNSTDYQALSTLSSDLTAVAKSWGQIFAVTLAACSVGQQSRG